MAPATATDLVYVIWLWPQGRPYLRPQGDRMAPCIYLDRSEAEAQIPLCGGPAIAIALPVSREYLKVLNSGVLTMQPPRARYRRFEINKQTLKVCLN